LKKYFKKFYSFIIDVKPEIPVSNEGRQSISQVWSFETFEVLIMRDLLSKHATKAFNNETEAFNNDTEDYNNATKGFNNETEVFNNETEVFNNETEGYNNVTERCNIYFGLQIPPDGSFQLFKDDLLKGLLIRFLRVSILNIITLPSIVLSNSLFISFRGCLL